MIKGCYPYAELCQLYETMSWSVNYYWGYWKQKYHGRNSRKNT